MKFFDNRVHVFSLESVLAWSKEACPAWCGDLQPHIWPRGVGMGAEQETLLGHSEARTTFRAYTAMREFGV